MNHNLTKFWYIKIYASVINDTVQMVFELSTNNQTSNNSKTDCFNKYFRQ